VLRKIPGGSWLSRWMSPVHLTGRLLERAVEDRAHYSQGWLLDVGCGRMPYRQKFSRVERYIGLDLLTNKTVDVYGSGLALPFPSGVFDTVLCNEVLEHVREPITAVAEAARVLKPGGILFVTAPQTWGLHAEPHDYYRFTKYGLQFLAEKNGLELIEVTPTSGMWATLAQRLADTVVHTYAAKRPYWVIRLLCFFLVPVQLTGYGLDQLFGQRGDTLDHVMLARKPDETGS